MSKTNINNAANEYVAQPRATKTEPHIYIHTYVPPLSPEQTTTIGGKQDLSLSVSPDFWVGLAIDDLTEHGFSLSLSLSSKGIYPNETLFVLGEGGDEIFQN